MAFFHSTIRQEGFHPENPEMSFMNDQFSSRKHQPASLDFHDELASLIDPVHDRQPPDDPYRSTHNIFDTSISLHDYHNHFNSTLPALNSSMRFDPHPPPAVEPPPSSFSQHASFTSRQTPSPHLQQQQQPQASRSRSRSRPPSSGGIGPQRTTRTRRNGSISSTSPPPHHYNSLSMMNSMARAPPQAIIIPGARSSSAAGNAGTPVSPLNGAANPWFMPGQGNGEYTLPTPDSIHSNHSIHSSLHHQQQHHHHGHFSSYPGGFGLSPSESHLPSALQSSHVHPGSLPKASDGGMGLGTPTSTNGLPSSLPVTSSLQAAASPTAPPPGAQDKQIMLASEKRRRRRESHNAVERRRRDNINEKISELATLIPECLLDGGNASGGANLPVSMDSPILASTSPGSALNMNPLSAMPMSPVDGESHDPWDPMMMPNGGAIPKKEKDSDVGLLGNLPPANGDAGGDVANGGVVKANKGMILRKSVEYIRYLQQLVTAQGARNRELEAELRNYRNGVAPTPSDAQQHLDNNMLYVMNGWGFPNANGLAPMPEEGGEEQNGAHAAESPLTNTTSPGSTGPDYEDSKKAGEKEVRGRKRSIKTRVDGAGESPTRLLRNRNGRGKAVTANGHGDDHDMSDGDNFDGEGDHMDI